MVKNKSPKINSIIPLKASSEDIKSGTTTKRTGNETAMPNKTLPSFLPLLAPPLNKETTETGKLIVTLLKKGANILSKIPKSPISVLSLTSETNHIKSRIVTDTRLKNLTAPFEVNVKERETATLKSIHTNGKTFIIEKSDLL